MIDNLLVKINCKIYKGFMYEIPNDKATKMSSMEIIDEVKNYMSDFFKYNNLVYLSENIKTVDFHIHDDIPYNRNIIYLCDDTHGN